MAGRGSQFVVYFFVFTIVTNTKYVRGNVLKHFYSTNIQPISLLSSPNFQHISPTYSFS